MQIHKYPRTPHIEGSRLQPGDQDLAGVPFESLRGQYLVVEEKIDGANAAISFGSGGELRLQSRGHYLSGGAREKHFALLKTWASSHARELHERLGSHRVMYGEWVYAKHTVYYDALPHYFLEFDVLDLEAQEFLSTERRRALLDGAPVASVPVLREGPLSRLSDLTGLVSKSVYKSRHWKQALRAQAIECGLLPDRVVLETDASDEAEGLYVKAEQGGRVVGRFKWVRASFLTAVVDSGTHWLHRPIVPNALSSGVSIFGSPS